MVAYVGLEVQIHGLEETSQTWEQVLKRVRDAVNGEFWNEVEESDIKVEVTEHAG